MGGGAAGDTIVALSSGRPPAAIAIVRMGGPAALSVGEAVAGPLGPERSARLHRLRNPADGSTIDHALVLHFEAPDSSTGEDIVEFQCHGGKAVIAALVLALIAFDGVREAEPGEFTRRALINGKIDLTQAEGLAELLEAETEAQRKSALRRSEGALRTTVERWRAALIEMAAEIEVAIDYSDEEDGAMAHGGLDQLAELIAEMEALLAAPRVEKLRDGVRVVVAGPPNSGKSSLVNALAGQRRAIVTAIPGTTRDRIEVPLTIGGMAVVLVDTAGLRESDDAIERIGMELTQEELDGADLILWLGTAGEAPQDAVVIAGKSDLEEARRPGLAVSAVSGNGLAQLKKVILRRASRVVPSGTPLSLNEREALLISEAGDALLRVRALRDPVLIAEELRTARGLLDQIVGRAGLEEVLDSLFAKFCLGK